MPKPLYTTEADLCAAFIAWSARHGWTAYAEIAGWDLVLVRPSGVQIGVQAKLRFNLKVMAQALDDIRFARHEGPDYRAILVGALTDGAQTICEHIGLALFAPYYVYRKEDGPEFSGDTEIIDTSKSHFRRYNRAWLDCNPAKRIELPDYVPDVAAGASSPLQLTPWKIGALRLLALLDIRGYVTRADFREHGINPTRWTVHHSKATAWLLAGDQRGHWVRGPGLPQFDTQHPTVYPQIRGEVAARLAAGQQQG
jgi:hypothetical protein